MDKGQKKINNYIRNSTASSKRLNAEKKYNKEKALRLEDNKKNEATIKELSDMNGALESEVNRLTKLLALREEQESLIICKNEQGYITDIVRTMAYNERVPLQGLKEADIDLLKVCGTLLYQKFPFLYEKDGNIEMNKTIYNKYLIVGGLI